MKKIILLCAGGMSTSLMVTKMENYAASINYECSINAYGVNAAAEVGKDADIILFGPQVRYAMDEIKSMYPETPIIAMDMMDYGMMNGEKILKKVIETLK